MLTRNKKIGICKCQTLWSNFVVFRELSIHLVVKLYLHKMA